MRPNAIAEKLDRIQHFLKELREQLDQVGASLRRATENDLAKQQGGAAAEVLAAATQGGKWRLKISMTAGDYIQAVIGLVLILTLAIAIKSYNAAEHNFEIDQRPYLWPTTVRFVPVEAGKPVMVNIFTSNYGKSPAVDVELHGDVLLGPQGLTMADKWFESANRLSDKDLSAGSVVPPGVPAANPPAPSGFQFDTIPSDKQIAPEAVQIVQNHLQKTVVARFRYKDIFGNVFHSDVCYFSTPNGVVAVCPSHNEMK